MSSLIEKRRGTIINVIYFALILAAFYFFFKYLFRLFLPFLVAFLLAALLHRPVRFVTSKTPLNRSVTSTVFVLLVIGVIGFLLFLLGNSIAVKVRGFYDFFMLKLKDLPAFAEELKNWAVSNIGFLPKNLRVKAEDAIILFFDDFAEKGFSKFSGSVGSVDWSSILIKGGSMLKGVVGKIPSVLIGIVISIVACVFITIDYNNIKAFVLRQFPEPRRTKIVAAKNLAVKTLSGMFKAYGLIMLITFTELCVGFYLLYFLKILSFNSTYIVPIAILIAIVDIIPVLGTGTVLIPWAVYSFITVDIKMGVGLLVMYVVILVIRQVIEPKLVAGQAGLSPIVTIISMYVGTKLLGVLGFFILPFFVILINKFNEAGIIHLFKLPEKKPPENGASPDQADPEPKPEPEPAPTQA